MGQSARTVQVGSWAAALAHPLFPPAAVLLVELGRNTPGIAAVVRTCRSVGSRVVCDARTLPPEAVRSAVAAGAMAWNGTDPDLASLIGL